MVKRVAQRLRDGSSPGAEFFKRFGRPGAITLGYTVGTHRTPFVVVSFKPDFAEVFEFSILGDIAWRQMAVIIENGLVLGKLVVEPPSGAGLEKEIRVNEFFHDEAISYPDDGDERKCGMDVTNRT